MQVKAGEIVQLEKQLTENARSHQDAMFEKHKELSALQAQLDKVDADLCFFRLSLEYGTRFRRGVPSFLTVLESKRSVS